MRAALLKLARELRMADPELGGEEAYFEALARMAHTQAVIYEALNRDVVGILFSRLCNPLEPRVAVAFGIATPWLLELTKELREQLKADHEAAAALYPKLIVHACATAPQPRPLKAPPPKLPPLPPQLPPLPDLHDCSAVVSCKNLREAKKLFFLYRSTSLPAHELALSAAELATLGKLGCVLPALQSLLLAAQGTSLVDGGEVLAEGLGAGALPAVTQLGILKIRLNDRGSELLAAALARGALARLENLLLASANIGDAGVVALAPAVRQLIAINCIDLADNPFGDQGIASLVAPPAAQDDHECALPRRSQLARLTTLGLQGTQITAAGCATLAAALDGSALPALQVLDLDRIALPACPGSVAARAAVKNALIKSRARYAYYEYFS